MSTLITWYGHATLGFATNGLHVLIDPFFSGNPVVKVKAEEITADYIIVTHGHGDHVGDTIEICNRTGATAISNAEISKWLSNQGVQKNTCPASWGWFPSPVWISQINACPARFCFT